MNAIILPSMCTDVQLERIWADVLEAIQYEKEHPSFETRVVLERFDSKGLPIYHANGFLFVEDGVMKWRRDDVQDT